MKKVLVIDTSILCVWLRVPGKEHCGPSHDRWNFARVEAKILQEQKAGTTFVLPLACIIETGNHISRVSRNRREHALGLAKIMKNAAEQNSPWAAFSDQSVLWGPDKLKSLAAAWPDLAAQKLSLADVTVKDVADFYAQSGFEVEIITGDQGLKAYEPVVPAEVPRRRRKR